MSGRPSALPEARIHIRVTGRVQGVGFRAFVAQHAQLSGVTGWVRNVGHDQVETVAEGRRENLEHFLQAVKTGPRMSVVRDVRVVWEEPRGEFRGFNLRWI
ncbi:MAG: acylphosphatase [Chloroflexi bacterium]|nr:acylphosphatase [Chloroflexota bacterium]